MNNKHALGVEVVTLQTKKYFFTEIANNFESVLTVKVFFWKVWALVSARFSLWCDLLVPWIFQRHCAFVESSQANYFLIMR